MGPDGVSDSHLRSEPAGLINRLMPPSPAAWIVFFVASKTITRESAWGAVPLAPSTGTDPGISFPTTWNHWVVLVAGVYSPRKIRANQSLAPVKPAVLVGPKVACVSPPTYTMLLLFGSTTRERFFLPWPLGLT